MSDDPGARAGLEAEREFLLRSLDDLDGELLAGNIDPDTYRVLHDDYTARASAVIRSIDDGTPRVRDDTPRVPVATRFVTVAGIVVFAALAAFLLARAVGQRSPGQTITGDAQANRGPTAAAGPAAALAGAKQAAEAQPGDYVARLDYARALMSSGDYPDAVKEFVAASKIDPTQPEPLAYSGWITALVARQIDDPGTRRQLVGAAISSIDRAIAADPGYPDAYAFKGVVLAELDNAPCPGATALQQFLVAAPTDSPMRDLVLSALAKAVKAGHCPALASIPTTKP